MKNKVAQVSAKSRIAPKRRETSIHTGKVRERLLASGQLQAAQEFYESRNLRATTARGLIAAQKLNDARREVRRVKKESWAEMMTV
jgi:hypothetical protein